MSTALRSLSNRDLLISTKNAVARERGITIEVLNHLVEVERRQLYLELGHSSMFAYCTDELGYSTSAAKRRISTARCIAEFPEALPLLRVNKVNLSTVTQVFRIMTPQNSHAILDRISGKSQREVEAIVAEYEPLEALPKERSRTVVVRVPLKEGNQEPVLAPAKTATSFVDTVVPADQVRNRPEPETPAQAPVQFERRVVVQFSAHEAVMSKLEAVRSLASHRLPANAPLEQVIDFMADYFLRREDPKARHERREAKTTAKPVTSPQTSFARAIPAHVRDEVFVRDEGRCCYVGPDGKRCASKHVLQIDHIQPVARGGSASIGNLRLLCAYHNRLEAERLMGPVAARPGP